MFFGFESILYLREGIGGVSVRKQVAYSNNLLSPGSVTNYLAMNNKIKNTEYAIVDIETTGGNARGSKITEIAILIHDGEQIIARWESLVNPEQDIPPAIFALTGITNEMVAEAPVFGDIAEKVHLLLEGRVFVAHNVNFDYSFVRHQLEEEGYKWSARKLCTVRMARKIRPGLPSYSLGRLCDRLTIPISSRHRAGGDADATAILFGKLLEWDQDAVVQDMLRKASPDQRLPPNLHKEDFDNLPEVPGVYYFLNQAGKVIYVGKAIHLKKRVASHFTGHSINQQRQYFLREIYHITYETCATELMAFLLECAEIKRLWPMYNRALKRFEPKFGLFTYQGQDGYDYLGVGRLSKYHACIQVFNREYDAIRTLQKLAAAFDIDYHFCRFGQAQVSRPLESKSDKATRLPEKTWHNSRVEEAITYLQEQQPSFYILDRGRVPGEQSCIWVERGLFYGMGYIDEQCQLSDPSDIRQNLHRYRGNHYMMQLILDYAEKHPAKVHSFTVASHLELDVEITKESPYQQMGMLF